MNGRVGLKSPSNALDAKGMIGRKNE